MADALAAIEEAVRLSGRHPWSLAELGSFHAMMGETTQAEAVHRELIARSCTFYVQGFILSLIPAWLGRMDEAFVHVEQAFAERDPVLLAITSWPTTRPLWSDPRYSEMLSRLKLRQPPRTDSQKR